MYAAHPNVIRTPSGDLLVLFHSSPFLGYSHHSHPLFQINACRSVDDGRTWGKSEFIASDPRGGVIDFGTHTLPDGSVYLHASSNELIPAKGYVNINFESPPHAAAIGDYDESVWVSRPGIPFWIRSNDNGYTWSLPKRFPEIPGAIWGHPAEHSGVCRSGILVLPDGRLLMPSKATDNPEGNPPYFGMIRSSKDMGKTWDYGGVIADDPVAHFSEPTITMTPSGRILVLFRCHPKPKKGAQFLALVYSDDLGKTWSSWKPTSIKGSPGHILKLSDNRIFITAGTRKENQRGCIARIVDPEGTNLDSETDLLIRNDSLTSDCGYPWAVELYDGKVLIVYYYTYSDQTRGIEGTIVEEV